MSTHREKMSNDHGNTNSQRPVALQIVAGAVADGEDGHHQHERDENFYPEGVIYRDVRVYQRAGQVAGPGFRRNPLDDSNAGGGAQNLRQHAAREHVGACFGCWTS